jgi:hypothetical protein
MHGQLRHLLEARLSKPRKRECVQVLRLLETFGIEEVKHASKPSRPFCVYERPR